ncbi:unnamed protein product [Phyllotreta striolata]|uniref:Uncharacterized protein n=1 Tax=Phyllotreta striolata TaxID=444603 RepID=A0A9N9TKM1_PHYSR|nr:unnamed protein product [Phyllotreta striolata]
MAKGYIFLFAAFLVSGFPIMLTQQKEILMEEEIPILEADKQVEYINNDRMGEPGVPCEVEYQVMKKEIGTCMRLGRTTRGCVAGHYLDLLHPECM